MKHAKMTNGLFKGPVEKVLPEGFDAQLIESFFNGSERAVAALIDADARAPGDIIGTVMGNEPIFADEPVNLDEGGGAKPKWAKGGDSTTTDTTDDTVSSGGKGGGRKNKKVEQADTAPEEETAPKVETTSDPALESEPASASEVVATPPAGVDYISGSDTPDGFNVWIDFVGEWTASQRQNVEAAAELISDIVTGDIADSNGIDDIMLTAQLTSIDGTDGYWGWGGYNSVRSGSRLPDEGYLRLDTADIARMESYNLIDDFAFHEMLHAMGFGTGWSSMGLVETVNGSLRFTGENATLAYNNEFSHIASGDGLSGFGVPVEMEGGSGTAGVHWDDDTFGSEMMTGQLNGTNSVSEMTIAALEDMGYETIFDPDVYGYA